jgi:hypothetical protein
MHSARSTSGTSSATLEPVRFGEFLRERNLINDEQWLAALAEHWSAPSTERRTIGATIVERGFLPAEVVEAEARTFHDDLDVIEVTGDDEVAWPAPLESTDGY